MGVRELPLLFAVFLDLVGFGMAFPDIQLRAEAFGAPGWMIGALLASYFVVQTLASPRWGALSDHVGRKPVLLVCTALSALSMIVYAFAQDVGLMLASRILAGLAAANVVVAQAYVADNTHEDQRAAAMGRVSAAILIGLIAGPAIGGELAARGGNWLMGLTAASLSGLSFVWILFGVLAQPPVAERKPGSRAVVDLRLLREVPDVRRLFAIAAAGWFVLACLEGTFGRLIRHMFGYGQREFGWIFSYESLLGAFAGLLLGWIAKRASTKAILSGGYFAQGVGVGLTPVSPWIAGTLLAAPASLLSGVLPFDVEPGFVALLMASTIYALGIGFVNPTINTVSSTLTPEDRQGELFGLLQATRSLGFLVGPVIGGAMFDRSPASPYYLAAAVALAAGLAILTPGYLRAAVPGARPGSSETTAVPK